MYVFFDTECTQDLEKSDGSFEHVPNLICAQKMCSKCIAVDKMNADCEVWYAYPWVLGGTRRQIIFGCPDHSRTRFVISHNSRGYDAQFLLRGVLELKWVPQLIKDGTKILSMVVENFHYLDSLNFLPMSLKSMPKSIDLTFKKGYYSHFFNTAENLDYVGSYPEPEYYGADMSGYERAQFLDWRKEQKGKIFRNKEELEAYCMDVNVEASMLRV
jgi:hypothetical protein